MLTFSERQYVIDRLLEMTEKIRELQHEIEDLGYFVGDDEFWQKYAPNKSDI